MVAVCVFITSDKYLNHKGFSPRLIHTQQNIEIWLQIL